MPLLPKDWEALLWLRQSLGMGAALDLVGGAVRDLLRKGCHEGDCDLATDLLPEQVMARLKGRCPVIPTGIQHGTVTAMVRGIPLEITTYRGDGDYLDGRRPEQVRLGVTLMEDLGRRDFTINAMAVPVACLAGTEDWRDHVVDPFGGKSDLALGVIRAVGDPLQRFAEDGLRALRACRFASQLGFEIEARTEQAIPQRLEVSRKVAVERVLAEMTKLLCGVQPEQGLGALERTGLLDLWMAELRPMVGCEQNHYHAFTVWEHAVEAVCHVVADPALRWAAWLHDAGKPAVKTSLDGSVHFYGHEAASETTAREILKRLRASRALQDEVLALIRHHGLHPEPEWGDSACRRLLRRLQEDGLGLERWGALRLADQIAKGFGEASCRPTHEAILKRLRILAAQKPPLSSQDLALDGRALMALAGRSGGPWLGDLQRQLLEVVLEDPSLNTEADLRQLALERLSLH